MKTKILTQLLIALAFLPTLGNGQGTMIFDQQSSDESNGGVGISVIQDSQPMGQSFTPSLDGIGFVRFHFFDMNRNNGIGAVLYINLRSDSITGQIVDSTAPVALPDNFGSVSTGFVDFLFSGNVPLQPGVKYYLQPIVQSGDRWGIFGDSFGYPGGDLYVNGIAFSSDLWFREGVIVPEPSDTALLVVGGGIFAYARRKQNSLLAKR